jgi:hypothetical protein
MLPVPLNCTLKVVKAANFILHNKNEISYIPFRIRIEAAGLF